MFVTQLQKALAYIRETQDIALFTTMADAGLSAAFRASPLFYIMLPFIGFLLTVNALMNGYLLAKANNRNFDLWFLFITSTVCAVLASISLYGAAISAFLSFSFTAGPWFFFSSLAVALSHQLLMLGLNLLRAYESPQNSIQRMHYIQAALNNLFVMAILASALGAVVFVLLFPIIPAAGTAFSIAAVLFTGFDILWRMIPREGKQLIKGWFYLSKPEVIQDAIANQEEILKPKDSKEIKPKHHRMFTCCDYSAVIRLMEMEKVKPYLLELIQYKLQLLVQKADPQNEKIKDKISLLKVLLSEIEKPQEISKSDALQRYPLAFQSFWAEKGEVEQIFDAVTVSQDRHRHREENNPSVRICA
ncbi:Uncharacterised protein [Legionella steigerwaltii]|uniref:Uncharacterized protein n=1 Tax=Legionella steigerwaltii TaxID=460 RepID=A0A378L997_9GAMM|nr:hypothetical protein [Legionella steigerwaltii]KTD80929.1 hypothetical protein Lstg_0156 [Legionella steigerwaltii]STY23383.1 Uncharacterised protein [Legionella steigerwaltii]